MYHHESEEIYKLLNYDAILFDVDGTLIDSAPGIINTLKEVFAKMGVDTTNVNLRRYLGPPLRKSFGEHFTDPALIEKALRPFWKKRALQAILILSAARPWTRAATPRPTWCAMCWPSP